MKNYSVRSVTSMDTFTFCGGHYLNGFLHRFLRSVPGRSVPGPFRYWPVPLLTSSVPGPCWISTVCGAKLPQWIPPAAVSTSMDRSTVSVVSYLNGLKFTAISYLTDASTQHAVISYLSGYLRSLPRSVPGLFRSWSVPHLVRSTTGPFRSWPLMDIYSVR